MATETEDSAVHTYVVDKVEDVFGPISSLSAPNRRKRITFHLPDGVPQFVEVDFTADWVEQARAAIEQHVNELLEVLSMRGEPLT